MPAANSALKVSELPSRATYGIITVETLDAMFERRLLAADLLSRSRDRCTNHAARIVLMTLEAVRAELLETIK